MKKIKHKQRWKHFIVIISIALVALLGAYYISTIPEVELQLPSPTEIGCTDEVHCPDGETCRREISATTKNYFGPYKCLLKVPTGSICEIWQHCESGTCSAGRCAE